MITNKLKDVDLRYDVIVVGSGAAGGISAHVLAKAGVKTLMIDAGRDYDPEEETAMFDSVEDAPIRGEVIPGRKAHFYEAMSGGFEIPDEPYVVYHNKKKEWTEGKAISRYGSKQNFMWYRNRLLGGRTNNWGRVSLRMGAYDFKPKSRDGLGVDWPIEYKDIEPYYQKVEKLIGVFGTVEGLENNPDGIFQPAPKFRICDHLFKQAGAKVGRTVISARAAVLTKELNDRMACFYATPCNRGCSIGAAFQSPNALIRPAVETGKLHVLCDTMVYKVNIGPTGLAQSVTVINRITGKKKRIKAKAIFLGASTCSTARILLNSKSRYHRNGLGNNSGHVGKWLTDNPKSNIKAFFPKLAGLPPFNDEGVVSIHHAYSPWTDWEGLKNGKYNFPRGYMITGGGSSRATPEHYTFYYALQLAGDVYGKDLPEKMKYYFGSVFGYTATGEMIPNEKSYCEIDPEKKDKWGIPTLRFHFEWGEHEVNQVSHQQQKIQEIIESAGGQIIKKRKAKKMITTGGSVKHEAGTTRMSANENDGVTNSEGQLWDCKNVYVIDAGVFASNSCKSPTLTIMALAWRTTEAFLKQNG